MAAQTNATEATLAKARQRDESAFADLMREHQGMVYGMAYHVVGNSAVAEDIAQEVFLRLYRTLPGIESPDHLRFWLRRVTSRLCIDHARRRTSRPEVEIDGVPEPAAESRCGDALLEQRLRQLVSTLPAQARVIVTLRYQEDLAPSEIAELLGQRVNTIKSVLQRSLALLRAKVDRVLREQP